MTLPGRVTSAPPGLHGIDTNEVLNEEHCRVAKSRGFSFCIRYVSRTAGQSASDLSEAEARTRRMCFILGSLEGSMCGSISKA